MALQAHLRLQRGHLIQADAWNRAHLAHQFRDIDASGPGV
jgi:hypothetical protein